MNRQGLVATIVLAITLGIIVGSNVQSYNDQRADITVLPCSDWSGETNPSIPPYTFTGACELPNGYLSVPQP